MCPRCKSKEVIASQPVVEGGMAIGAQAGSILGGLVLLATGPFMIIGLTAGAVLGGWAGIEAGEALDSSWKHVCQNCGCEWREPQES